jgi:hypothetical protein
MIMMMMIQDCTTKNQCNKNAYFMSSTKNFMFQYHLRYRY